MRKLSVTMSVLVALQLVVATEGSHAQTIVKKRIEGAERLAPPKKLTVGPYDQYASTVSPSGEALAFTHKADLVSRVQIQDRKTGEVKDLLPVTADSQDPIFSPDGRLAFTYFKWNARGDVCWLQPKIPTAAADEKDIKCLKRTAESSGFQRGNPFWRSRDEIGYVEREIDGDKSRIVIENISSNQRTTLLEGRLWSPSMIPGGRYLAFSEVVGEGAQLERKMKLFELSSQKTYPLDLALPGLSGFPVLSDDEGFVYFSHFMNDTNDDRAIDGGDNGVIFRLPVSQVVSPQEAGAQFPEQLTSGDSSCSFPRATSSSLFMTCAFEGSLDIYELPSSGTVPTKWERRILDSAIQTSRSYQDRILLLNTLKYRSKSRVEIFDERLMSAHLLAGDALAARYYLGELRRFNAVRDRIFLPVLDVYLRATDLKKAQLSDEITREFRQQIGKFEAEIRNGKGEELARLLVRAALRAFLNEDQEAEKLLKQVKFSSSVRPYERYLFFETSQRIYQKSPKQQASLIRAYGSMLRAPEINEETKIYYAYRLLRVLQLSSSQSQTQASQDSRQQAIAGLNKGLGRPVEMLLNSEATVLRIISLKEDREKLSAYRDLDKLMNDSKDDYFLRKALYVRAIQNFAEAAEFKYLNFVAANWLKYTSHDSTEFTYARAVFAEASLDEAYGKLALNQLKLADNYFFQSVLLTDDLESHFGHIQSLMAQNQRATIDERYRDLKKREFIDDNLKFVDALLVMIDAREQAVKDPQRTKHLDEAIDKLESMEQDRDSSVRYLLLGYAYMEKLFRKADGAEVDRELLQKANRNLMLAYDLGRENDRVKASALMNLGLLHQRVQNHGLAARFFTLRSALPFEIASERESFAWVYPKALRYSFQPAQSADEIKKLGRPDLPLPLQERRAFGEMMANRFEEAAKAYQQVMKSDLGSDENRAKVSLAYGYTLLKLKRTDEARQNLTAALKFANSLKERKRTRDELIDFHPARIQIIAYGLLSQTGSDSERLEALEKRTQLLAKNEELIEDSLVKRIQTRLQLAQLFSKQDPARTFGFLSEALELTKKYGEDAQYNGNAVFRSVNNYLVHGSQHPENYRGKNQKLVQTVVERTIQSLNNQKISQPVLDFQNLKLQLLWLVFKARVFGEGQAGVGEKAALLKSPLGEKVRTESPIPFRDLEALAQGL